MAKTSCLSDDPYRVQHKTGNGVLQDLNSLLTANYPSLLTKSYSSTMKPYRPTKSFPPFITPPWVLQILLAYSKSFKASKTTNYQFFILSN